MKTKPPSIICTDDAWLLGAVEPPLSIEDLKEKMVDAYEGTPAALSWSIGDHEVYNFETEIGEIVGDAPGGEPGPVQTVAENVRHLMETCGGPLTALIQLCREADRPFFPRVRMNSHYDREPSDPGWGNFRREHPEFLIGLPGEDLTEGSIEYGIRTGLNFVFPQVREYKASIICEVFERFDVDGVELDFMRHPAFFRVNEAYQNRHLMTDLVRHVRDRMDEAGASRGRHIQLAVRVPPTLADSARIGLDVAHWMAEGLVNIVVAGGGFIPYETPIEEFVRAGADRGIAVYGCIEATRYADERNLRGIANRFWVAGASGIYLYNFYTMGPDWNKRVLNQLADPEVLKYLDKRYELDQTARFTTPYHCAFPVGNIEAAFRYGSPDAQLPVPVEETLSGRGPVLCLQVADDLESARTSGALARCLLALRFDNLTPDDVLEVTLNQELLPWPPSRDSFDGWMRQEVEARFWEHYPARIIEVKQPGVSVEYAVTCPPLSQGENRLGVRLLTDRREESEPVLLKGVELLLECEE